MIRRVLWCALYDGGVRALQRWCVCRSGLALTDLIQLERGWSDMHTVAVWRVGRRRVARASAYGGLSSIARVVYF